MAFRTAWKRGRLLRVPAALLLAAAVIGGCARKPGRRPPEPMGSESLTAYRETVLPQPPGEELALAVRPAGTAEESDAAPAAPDAEADSGEPGQAAPPAPRGFVSPLNPDGVRVRVTLEDCLRRAIAYNLRIQIARFGPQIAETNVAEAEAIFDPSWFLNNAVSRVKRDTGTQLAGATTLVAEEWDFATGLEALLPTGGSASLTQDWIRQETNSFFVMPNPQYDTGMALSLAQPLLRGAGPTVTRSPIVLAKLDHRVSLADFKREVMDTLLEVERTYWQLVLAQRSVAALEEALDAAEENRRVAQQRFDAGQARRVNLSLAESAVTAREADLIAARLALAQTSDRLKRLLNDAELPLDDPTLLEAAEEPLTDPVPVDRVMLQRTMLTAIKNRPELDQAEAAIRQRDLLEDVAANERLPRLDVIGSYGVVGLDRRQGNALDEQFGTEFFEWTAGFEFQVPLGNRARQAAHHRAQLERALAVKTREDTRQRILLEVSEAVRNLAAAEEAVLATRAAREAAQQTLSDQQANVTAGAALARDLLETQRDLAEAKVRETEALVDYMTGLAVLERAKGTLLEYNGIRVLDGEP